MMLQFEAIEGGGNIFYLDDIHFGANITTSSNTYKQLPSQNILIVYPNPSSGSSLATVLLPTALPSATLSISNVLGKAVYINQLGPLAAGTQQWLLPIAHLAPGLYVVHLNSPTIQLSQKLTIIKD
jgi:hypothetical protein